MADPIINSSVAPRQFLTSAESHYRLIRAPEVGCLQLNPSAPSAAVIALALVRADAIRGVIGVFLQDGAILNEEQQLALEAVTHAAEELRMLLAELQDRDGLHYRDATQ